MPGFNQRGPENQGPMTGGRRGLCTNQMSPGQQFSGSGYGRGNGKRGNRGMCQNRQGGANFDPGAYASQSTPSEVSLKERADILEAELQAIKKELQSKSKSDA